VALFGESILFDSVDLDTDFAGCGAALEIGGVFVGAAKELWGGRGAPGHGESQGRDERELPCLMEKVEGVIVNSIVFRVWLSCGL
jgi:hypothetical protein